MNRLITIFLGLHVPPILMAPFIYHVSYLGTILDSVNLTSDLKNLLRGGTEHQCDGRIMHAIHSYSSVAFQTFIFQMKGKEKED